MHLSTVAKIAELSLAQLEAGNYKKKHYRLHGFDISIENPKGSTRSGKSKEGKSWSVTMNADYGYIKGTVGRDKDHLDVFVGPDKDSEIIFVVNQVHPGSGYFDEHKAIMGCTSEEEARKLYLGNYDKNWRGLGDIKSFTLQEFKDWVGEGDMSKRALMKKSQEDGGGFRSRVDQGLSSIADRWNALPLEQRMALGGAGIGTIGGALMPARRRRSRLLNALLMGMAGAGSGYAIPKGLEFLQAGSKDRESANTIEDTLEKRTKALSDRARIRSLGGGSSEVRRMLRDKQNTISAEREKLEKQLESLGRQFIVLKSESDIAGGDPSTQRVLESLADRIQTTSTQISELASPIEQVNTSGVTLRNHDNDRLQAALSTVDVPNAPTAVDGRLYSMDDAAGYRSSANRLQGIGALGVGAGLTVPALMAQSRIKAYNEDTEDEDEQGLTPYGRGFKRAQAYLRTRNPSDLR